jgi:hypothetical protein
MQAANKTFKNVKRTVSILNYIPEGVSSTLNAGNEDGRLLGCRTV